MASSPPKERIHMSPGEQGDRLPAPATPRSLPLVSGPREGGEVRPAGAPRRVLLVCPPFQSTRMASLSVTQLATFLRERGLACDEAYLNLDLARLVGVDCYEEISEHHGLGAELLFAEGLHGVIGEAAASATLARLFGSVDERRRLRDRLADRCLTRLRAARPDLLGLTTSLNQLLPALWVANLAKTELPEVRIVLGGSACSAPMGQRILQGYPMIDWVVDGHGELPLLELAEGNQPASRLLQNHVAMDLNALPIPNYRRFLAEAGELADHPRFWLAFESSRGCWWGQKIQCTFCGLNGQEMAFRQKAAERVVTEIRSLWDEHGKNLFATDSILSLDHLRQVMPRLATYPSGPRLFYEVKANLSQADIVLLARAGVRSLQPGIESLSTRLLTLLRKGVKAIQNLALLKWSREQGIGCGWNQLCVIPGESAEDYETQLEVMERVPHFSPPQRVNPIRIDRYSPYADRPTEFGWEGIEPGPEYRLFHPHLDDAARRDIAYHFVGLGPLTGEAYLPQFSAAVARWQERHRQHEGLFLDPTLGLLRTEPDGVRQFRPDKLLDRVLECTHEIAPVARVQEHARCKRSALENMAKAGILYLEGEKVINLAVRANVAGGPIEPSNT